MGRFCGTVPSLVIRGRPGDQVLSPWWSPKVHSWRGRRVIPWWQVRMWMEDWLRMWLGRCPVATHMAHEIDWDADISVTHRLRIFDMCTAKDERFCWRWSLDVSRALFHNAQQEQFLQCAFYALHGKDQRLEISTDSRFFNWNHPKIQTKPQSPS